MALSLEKQKNWLFILLRLLCVKNKLLTTFEMIDTLFKSVKFRYLETDSDCLIKMIFLNIWRRFCMKELEEIEV